MNDSGRIKEFISFSRVLVWKWVQLKFELTYCDIAVEHNGHWFGFFVGWHINLHWLFDVLTGVQTHYDVAVQYDNYYATGTLKSARRKKAFANV